MNQIDLGSIRCQAYHKSNQLRKDNQFHQANQLAIENDLDLYQKTLDTIGITDEDYKKARKIKVSTPSKRRLLNQYLIDHAYIGTIPKHKPISYASRIYQEAAFSQAYWEEPEEEILDTNDWISNWDRRTFADDYRFFNDTNIWDITADLFEQNSTEISDQKYHDHIIEKLSSTYPIQHNEIGEEETNVGRALGNVINRMLIQDTAGRMNILQHTPAEHCNIPSQYQIEKIAMYADVKMKSNKKFKDTPDTGAQAYWLSIAYQRLNLDFNTVKKLNMKIRKERHAVPWKVAIGKTTLQKLSLAMKEIMEAPQKDPDWAHSEEFLQGNYGAYQPNLTDEEYQEYIDSTFSDVEKYNNALLSMNGEHYTVKDRVREPFGATNTVGLYTYWNNSVIKRAEHLECEETNPQFKKIFNAIMEKKVKDTNLPKLHKFIRELTPAQQKKIREAIQEKYAA